MKNLDCWEGIVTKYEPNYEYLIVIIRTQRDATEESKRKDSRVLQNITNGVEDSIFPNISTATNAHQAWDILEQACTKVQRRSRMKNSKFIGRSLKLCKLEMLNQ